MMTQEIKVHVIHTGTVIVNKNLPYTHQGASPYSWTGLFQPKSDLIEVPVSTYLIEHPKGLVLIDSGWSSVNRTHWGQIKNLSFQYPVNKCRLPVGQAIDEQLSAMGIKPQDLSFVLMSHLHCDHADGLRLIKSAPEILTSAEELHASHKDRLHYLSNELKGIAIKPFQYQESQLGPYHRSYDVFGDGLIQMVWTPGHSAGLSSTIIRSLQTDKFLLLGSDVGYSFKSFEQELVPSVHVNVEQAKASLARVKEVSEEPNCLMVVANHDPEIVEQVISL